MKEEVTTFEKSNFTLCNYRENDKCPPWSIQSLKCYMIIKKNNLL